MNKKMTTGIILLIAILLLSSFALADTTEIKNTTIDYISYREVVANEPGVIYPIKLTNTGYLDQDYKILPDSDIIRNIGSYRIDPSDKITIKAGEQATVYIYLAVEKPISGRTEIPVKISTGLSETTINLVARTIGPFQETQGNNFLMSAFKTVLIIFLIIVIILALFFGFRRIRKKKEEELDEELKPDFDEDVKTYY